MKSEVLLRSSGNSTERLETTAALVSSNGFKQSMNSLAGTGVTIQGRSISEVVSDLQYASESVDGVEKLSMELEKARTTYQWTTLIGLLGLVAGITSIYI